MTLCRTFFCMALLGWARYLAAIIASGMGSEFHQVNAGSIKFIYPDSWNLIVKVNLKDALFIDEIYKISLVVVAEMFNILELT